MGCSWRGRGRASNILIFLFMGVEKIEQQYNFSGWGWLRLGKGQQYLFNYEVIMDLLKFKSKSPLYLE